MHHPSRLTRPLWLLGAVTVGLGVSLSLSGLAGAAPSPEPAYGSATVDGSTAEWSPSDRWGTIVSNDPPHRAVATAALRYDCDAETLFVLVMALPGESLQTTDPAETYVRLGPTGKLVSGLSGNDGTAPDFSWVGQSGDTATGFEASAPVAPGSYPASLRIHAKLPDDSADGYETVDLQPRYADLTITCIEEVTTTTTTTTTTAAPTTIETTTSVAPATIESTTTTSVAADPAAVTSTSAQAPVLAGATPDDPPRSVAAAGATRQDPPDPPRVAATELARTGAGTGPLVAIGSALVLVGGVLMLRARTLRGLD